LIQLQCPTAGDRSDPFEMVVSSLRGIGGARDVVGVSDYVCPVGPQFLVESVEVVCDVGAYDPTIAGIYSSS